MFRQLPGDELGAHSRGEARPRPWKRRPPGPPQQLMAPQQAGGGMCEGRASRRCWDKQPCRGGMGGTSKQTAEGSKAGDDTSEQQRSWRTTKAKATRPQTGEQMAMGQHPAPGCGNGVYQRQEAHDPRTLRKAVQITCVHWPIRSAGSAKCPQAGNSFRGKCT